LAILTFSWHRQGFSTGSEVNVRVWLLVLFSFFCCYAQSDYCDGPIYSENNQYFCADYKIKDFDPILGGISDYSSFKSRQRIANGFGYAGGFALGFGLTSALLQGEPAYFALAGLGAALIIPGLIIEGKGKEHLQQAIQEFNATNFPDQQTEPPPGPDTNTDEVSLQKMNFSVQYTFLF